MMEFRNERRRLYSSGYLGMENFHSLLCWGLEEVEPDIELRQGKMI